MSTAQAYVYMMNCQRDPSWLKTLVSVVLCVRSILHTFLYTKGDESSPSLVEAIHTLLVIRQLFYYTVSSFGDFDAVVKIDWLVSP